MTWPNWERCVRIIMIVPVRDEPSYELTRSSLKEMWDMFADDKLKESGLEVKQNIVLTKGKRAGSILNPNFQYLCM